MAHENTAKVSQPDFSAVGLAPSWAAAYRDAARRRACDIAHLHASTLIAAYHAESLVADTAMATASPPAWRARWPRATQHSISLVHAKALVMRATPAAFGFDIAAALAPGVVRVGAGPSLTLARRRGPPRIQLSYAQTPAAALTLAHEVGHWLQMGGWRGQSGAPPSLAAAETGAMVFERLMLRALRSEAPSAGRAAACDDALAMFVRHPARDAWEQAGFRPQAWPAIAAAYAPGQDWAALPKVSRHASDQAWRALAYGVAAALAAVIEPVLHANPAAAAQFGAWLRAGPDADLRGLSSLLPAGLDDPALYERAYDETRRWMESPLDDDEHRHPVRNTAVQHT